MKNQVKQSKTNQGWVKKLVCVSLATSACVLALNGIVQPTFAAGMIRSEGDQARNAALITTSTKTDIPTVYEKANYNVVADELYKEVPTTEELTKEQAAELGAQMIWESFGVDLEGATLWMGYSSGTETFPRAFWSGDVRFSSTRTIGDTLYTFTIDAVTGESFDAAMGRTLDMSVPLGLDKTLAANPQEYIELAKKFAKEHKILSSEVQKIEYESQGFSNNDPTITVKIFGVTGEKALLTYSRYDKQLLGVTYHGSEAISEKALEKLLLE